MEPTVLRPEQLDRIDFVLPYLAIGSYAAADEPSLVRAKGITHCLRLIEDRPSLPARVVELFLPLSDDGDSDLGVAVEQASQFIDGAREAGGRVLVFCALGVNRSPALVAAYLRRSMGYSATEAAAVVSKSRKVSSIHARYLAQLEAL